MTLTDEPAPAGGGTEVPTDLLALNREAIRTLHLLARELDDAVHATCMHEPLSRARDELLTLAVRMQIALRDLA